MQLQDMRDWVEDYLQDTANERWTTAEIDRAINYAIKVVAAMCPWSLLGTLQGKDTDNITNGTTAYDLPSAFFMFKQATWDGNWCTYYNIDQLPMLDHNDFHTPEDDSPICYLADNQIIYLPDLEEDITDGRVIYFGENAPTLSGDEDENPMNELTDHPVVLKATGICWTKDDDATAAMTKLYDGKFSYVWREIMTNFGTKGALENEPS